MMKSITRGLLLGLVVASLAAMPATAKEQPPAPTKMKELKFPDFKEFKTKNGIEALVVEHKEQPVVSIYFAFKSGDAVDPEGKESLAGIAIDQLNKGTESRTALELAKWIESVGGSVSASSQADLCIISVTVLSDYADVAWDYLADVILNPTFPADELETIRKRLKTSLELELSNPDAMANRHFATLVYGDHPYGKQPTVASVESITREDVVGFYDKNFVPNNVLVGVVGDVKWKDVRKALEKRFEDWEAGMADAPAYTGAPAAGDTKIFLYHKPGAVQTEIRVGHLGPKADNEDWPAITVANRILGGGADARLFMILREEKGWTYGAYSSFSRNKDLGRFVASTQVRTEVTDSALVELIHQLDRIREEPVTDEDLENAKNYLIGNFPLQIETPSQIARRVANIKLLGLDMKNLETWRDRLADVTIEDVNRVMNKYMNPDKAYVVLVGDATEVGDKVGVVADVAMYDIAGEPMDMAAMAVEGVDYVYDTSSLRDMKATYALKYQSMALGDMAVTLAKEGDVVVVTSTMDGMIKLDESYKVKQSNLAPVSYRREMSTPGGSVGAELDFTDTAASGVVRTPSQPGTPPEPREVTVELVKGTLVDGCVDLAISCLPLEVNKRYRFPVLDSQTGSLVNIDAEILELVSVETPAGAYETFKIRLSRPDGEQLFYIGKDAPHFLVKMEVPAQGLVSELKALN